MDCSTMVKSNPAFDVIPGSFTKVFCPTGCGKKLHIEVFGSSIYLDKSSICRAAVFTGLVDDDKGGEVNV